MIKTAVRKDSGFFVLFCFHYRALRMEAISSRMQMD